jgi:hypothetical protein
LLVFLPRGVLVPVVVRVIGVGYVGEIVGGLGDVVGGIVGMLHGETVEDLGRVLVFVLVVVLVENIVVVEVLEGMIEEMVVGGFGAEFLDLEAGIPVVEIPPKYGGRPSTKYRLIALHNRQMRALCEEQVPQSPQAKAKLQKHPQWPKRILNTIAKKQSW